MSLVAVEHVAQLVETSETSALLTVEERLGTLLLGIEGPQGPAAAMGIGGGTYAPQSPQSQHGTVASLAAGGSTTVETRNVTAAKLGKLVQLLVSSTVWIKVELEQVSAGIVDPDRQMTRVRECDLDYNTPAPDWWRVPGTSAAGFDGWRLIITNLDVAESADVYWTVLWDETTS